MQFTSLKRPVSTIATMLSRWQQIRYRAFHDELTGLPNRYLFSDRLEQTLARALRQPPGFALVYADVDGFKAVNDVLGHWAGDELLKHVGSCLAAGLRAGDTAARLGGDEFALLLLDVDDAVSVRAAIRRIEDALRPPLRIDGRELAVSCSIGFSIFPHDGADASMLLRQADMAMYRHKRGSVRRVSIGAPQPVAPAAGTGFRTGAPVRAAIP
jgi:diguanylate cyclase (GGDEF)-like protein